MLSGNWTLNTSSEEFINKTNSISSEMVTFYSNLNKSKNVWKHVINQNLENIIVTKIDNNDNDMLNKFPSYEECTKATKN